MIATTAVIIAIGAAVTLIGTELLTVCAYLP